MLKAYGMAAVLCAFLSSVFAGKDDVRLTILDTLNKGSEVSITARDYSTLPTDIKPVTIRDTIEDDDKDIEKVAEQREAGVVPSRFRIQILASSQKGEVRKARRIVAAKVKYATSIVYHSPYYKLMVGDFSNRPDAEKALAQVKKLGYNDAWIVRTALRKR
ncbi:MAG: SPOR domain-containing protein [Chitinispirillaceae bacterium]|nr:SPOR domain-containing protein [Chitinispirillaceae bacterium]